MKIIVSNRTPRPGRNRTPTEIRINQFVTALAEDRITAEEFATAMQGIGRILHGGLMPAREALVEFIRMGERYQHSREYREDMEIITTRYNEAERVMNFAYSLARTSMGIEEA